MKFGLRSKRFAWASALVVVLCAFASAQWEYGGKVIGHYSAYTDDLATVNVGEGNIVVAWNKNNGSDYDIFAQKIDSAGHLQWSDEGLVVYEDDSIQQRQVAALADGYGGLFIVWTDWRHRPAQGTALYGQHLDAGGNKLWAPEGMRFTTDTLSYGDAQLLSDGHDGFVMVYQKAENLTDIGAQRVDWNGNTLWQQSDSNGIRIVVAPMDQGVYRTIRADDSTYVTVWLDCRFCGSPDSGFYEQDIYMQRYNQQGQTLWANSGIPAVHYTDAQGYLWDGHDVVPDGRGGAIVVWVDHRTTEHGDNMVLFADRISSSGQSLWRQNGLQLADEQQYEALEAKAFNLGNNEFMFWWGADLMMSYLNVWAGFIWPQPVILDSSWVYEIFSESGGIFKYIKQYWNGNQWVVGGAKMNHLGYQYWPQYPNSWAIFERLQIVTDGDGGLISCWSGAGLNIMMSRIYSDGHVGGDTATSVDDDQVNILPENLSISQNYPNPFNGETLVNYSLSGAADVSLRIFNLAGRMVWNKNLANQQAGWHSMIIDLSDNPSGVYFLRIATTDGEAKTIKMVLLK